MEELYNQKYEEEDEAILYFTLFIITLTSLREKACTIQQKKYISKLTQGSLDILKIQKRFIDQTKNKKEKEKCR